jgi:hypothetical protein
MSDVFDKIASNIRDNYGDSPEAQTRAARCIAKLKELRELHKCLLILQKGEVRELQYRALLADIAAGQRRLHKVRAGGCEHIFFKRI